VTPFAITPAVLDGGLDKARLQPKICFALHREHKHRLNQAITRSAYLQNNGRKILDENFARVKQIS